VQCVERVWNTSVRLWVLYNSWVVSVCKNCFKGWTRIRKVRPQRILRSLGLEGKDTRFEYIFKPMLILYGWSILAKQSEHGHLMILLSKSDLTYPLYDVSCYVLLSIPGWFFTDMVTILHIGLSLSIIVV